MAGIQLSGLASGLDTDTIITQLMSIERQPRTRIVTNQSVVTARKNALDDIEAKLKSLKTYSSDLSSAASWAPTQTVESEDTSKLTVAQSGGAAPGGYQIAITRMAAAAQQTFLFTPQAGASSVTVNGVAVTIDPGADLDGAAAAINSNSSVGVYAINAGGRLVLSSRTTGVASAFTASGAALAADPAHPAKAGVDSQISVDGTTVTSPTNIVTGAVPGVTLTLKGLTAGTAVSVGNPGPDKAAITAKLKSFVAAYNTTVDAISSRLNEKTVPNATTTADSVKGVLFGDSGLRDTLSSLRRSVTSTVVGMTGLTSLADIGISTGAATGGTGLNADSVAGKLTLDETKLGAALDANPLGVQKLLGGVSGTNGFAQAFTSVLDPLVTVNGVLDQRQASATTELSGLADALTRMDLRLTSREAALRKQFTAMEQALSKSSSLSSQIASKLGS